MCEFSTLPRGITTFEGSSTGGGKGVSEIGVDTGEEALGTTAFTDEEEDVALACGREPKSLAVSCKISSTDAI